MCFTHNPLHPHQVCVQVTNLFFIQLSSLAAMPTTCSQQPIRWQSGSLRTNRVTAEDSEPTSPPGSNWGHQVSLGSEVRDTWSIDYWLLIVCEQLRVQLVSSSVRQEVVSMETASVTARSTVLTPPMKLTVVSRSVSWPYSHGGHFMSQVCYTGVLQVCMCFSCVAGEQFQSSPVSTCFLSAHRVCWHLELSPV